MRKMSKAEQRDSAIETLREYCPMGTKVYTVLRGKPSSSGMSRHISLLVIAEHEGRAFLYDVSYLVARALDYRRADDGGLVVSGCGMDMGYHLVNSLSYTLHGMTGDQERMREIGDGRDPIKETFWTVDGRTYKPGYTLNHQWA